MVNYKTDAAEDYGKYSADTTWLWVKRTVSIHIVSWRCEFRFEQIK